jgi:hypothetical protein
MSVGFEADILPLFTTMDIEHMKPAGVSLDDYAYMSEPDNATRVYKALADASMPPRDSGEPPWSERKLQLFKDWMQGGYAS